MRPDSIRQDRCGRLRGRCPAHQHSGARTPSAAFGPARERLAAFLDLPIDLIGQIGAGRNRTTGLIDVAIVQSLYRKGEVKDLVAEYGHILVDEYHHLSAVSFEQVMRRAPAKYVTGLTATPLRKDGHHPIIYMQCGPIRFNVPVGRKSSQARLNTGSCHEQRRSRGTSKLRQRLGTLRAAVRGFNTERTDHLRCCGGIPSRSLAPTVVWKDGAY